VKWLASLPEHHAFVMEYVPGKSLNKVIKQYFRNTGAGLPETNIHGYFVELVDALLQLDLKGLVNRDINPSNIIVNGNTVKLIDLGISSWPGDPAFHNLACGTRDFVAPERRNAAAQAQNAKPGARVFTSIDTIAADVFSLGAVLYEMATGRVLPRDYRSMAPVINFRDMEKTSLALQDLIVRMVWPIPSDRITLEEIQQHPWFPHGNTVEAGKQLLPYMNAHRFPAHSSDLNEMAAITPPIETGIMKFLLMLFFGSKLPRSLKSRAPFVYEASEIMVSHPDATGEALFILWRQQMTDDNFPKEKYTALQFTQRMRALYGHIAWKRPNAVYVLLKILTEILRKSGKPRTTEALGDWSEKFIYAVRTGIQGRANVPN